MLALRSDDKYIEFLNKPCISHESCLQSVFQTYRQVACPLKDKYPNFEVGLKCIIMVF